MDLDGKQCREENLAIFGEEIAKIARFLTKLEQFEDGMRKQCRQRMRNPKFLELCWLQKIFSPFQITTDPNSTQFTLIASK